MLSSCITVRLTDVTIVAPTHIILCCQTWADWHRTILVDNFHYINSFLGLSKSSQRHEDVKYSYVEFTWNSESWRTSGIVSRAPHESPLSEPVKIIGKTKRASDVYMHLKGPFIVFEIEIHRRVIVHQACFFSYKNNFFWV